MTRNHGEASIFWRLRVQTIETLHVHDIHLGETLMPYATLEPRKAALPSNGSTRQYQLIRKE